LIKDEIIPVKLIFASYYLKQNSISFWPVEERE